MRISTIAMTNLKRRRGKVLFLVIGIVSSLYPAVRASRLDPSEAIRYV